MTARALTEEENRILNEKLRSNKPDASKQSSQDEQRIADLAKLSDLQYQRCREREAEQLKIGVGALDKLVNKKRKQLARESAEQKKVEAPDPDELWRSAGDIINHPRILDLFADELRREIAGRPTANCST